MQPGLRPNQPEAQILWGDEPTSQAGASTPREALEAGDHDLAESMARKAIAKDISDSVSMIVLAEALAGKGDFDGAIEWLGRAGIASPTSREPHLKLGRIYLKRNKAPKAVECFRRALEHDTRDFDTLLGLGEALIAKGDHDEANDVFRRAAATDPSRPEPHIWLAENYYAQRNFEDCLGAAQRALQASSRSSKAYEVYGRALAALGQTKEAVSAYRAAIKIDPLYADAYAHMANSYLQMAQPAQALEASIQAVNLQPDLPTAQVSRASALRLLGHIDESMVACHKAILSQARLPALHTILGHVYMDCGLPDEAAKSYERGLAIDDHLRAAHSALLVARQFTLKKTPAEVLDEAKKWQAMFGEPAYPRPVPSKRMQRIGFVSPDFNDSPVGRTVLALAKALRGVGVDAYFYGYGLEDSVTEEFREIGYWRAITGLDDETAATIIAEDKIDGLVDTTGHMERNRAGIFLQRPCGIQVTWLGNMGPSGSDAIDAVISDSHLSPLTADALHTCPVVRVPRHCMLFTAPSSDCTPGPLPYETSGTFTFGAVCSTRQINRRVIAAWSEILKSVSNSRLLMKAKGLHSTAIRKQFLSWFDANGVAPDRVVFLGNTSWPTHIATYQRIDLCLDPFPWSGAQTTLESAWMGLPTLTWQGEAMWQRGSGAVMKALGLDEYIAHTEDGYVRQAARLATQPDQLRHLRGKLRGTLTDSSFCDPAQFAQDFVKALESVATE